MSQPLHDQGTRLRKAREQAGLTQDELAKTSKISKRTIQRAESGETISPENEEDLASALGCWREDIFPDSAGIPAGRLTFRLVKSGQTLLNALQTCMLGVRDSKFAEFEVVGLSHKLKCDEEARPHFADGSVAMRVGDAMAVLLETCTHLNLYQASFFELGLTSEDGYPIEPSPFSSWDPITEIRAATMLEQLVSQLSDHKIYLYLAKRSLGPDATPKRTLRNEMFVYLSSQEQEPPKELKRQPKPSGHQEHLSAPGPSPSELGMDITPELDGIPF